MAILKADSSGGAEAGINSASVPFPVPAKHPKAGQGFADWKKIQQLPKPGWYKKGIKESTT